MGARCPLTSLPLDDDVAAVHMTLCARQHISESTRLNIPQLLLSASVARPAAHFPTALPADAPSSLLLVNRMVLASARASATSSMGL